MTTQTLTQSLKEQLQSILAQLDSIEDETIRASQAYKLLPGALALTIQILLETPLDFDTRIIRIKLNNEEAIGDTQAMLADALFIAENHHENAQKMAGLDWVVWIYDTKMGMPNQAIAYIKQQIANVPTLFLGKRYLQDTFEGSALDKLANLLFANGQQDEAIATWQQSFEKYPYIYKRNFTFGKLLLDANQFAAAEQVLRLHFVFSDHYQDNTRTQYGYTLKTLYESHQLLQKMGSTSALGEHPKLIALYFDILRNEDKAFGYEKKLDFYNRHRDELEALTQQYPQCSRLWAIVGNMYYLDVVNYKKAYDAYLHMLAGDEPNCNYLTDRMKGCCDALGLKLTDMPFKFTGSADILYNLMTECYEFWQENNEIEYVQLAEKFGKSCYTQFSQYFQHGIGDSLNNLPDQYARATHNCALCIRCASGIDPTQEACAIASKIHWEGYQFDPFIENIRDARWDASHANLHLDCIQYAEIYEKDYADELNHLERQFNYWYQIKSYQALNDTQSLTATYQQSKQLFIDFDDEAIESTQRFMYNCSRTFKHMILTAKQYQQALPELDWFLAKPLFKQADAEEFAYINYFAANAYSHWGDKPRAISCLNEAKNILNAANNALYEAEINTLLFNLTGETPVKNLSDYNHAVKTLFELPLTLKKAFLLDTSNSSENIQRLLDLINTFCSAEIRHSKYWITDNLCVEFFYKDATSKDYQNTYSIRYWLTKEDCSYEFNVEERMKTSGGFFSKKTEQTTHEFFGMAYAWQGEKLQKDWILVSKNPNNEAALQQQGNQLWNELNNRFLDYQAII